MEESRLAELERLLREAEQRVKEAEREREAERQRAERSEKQTRPTNLDEYVAACHTLVFSQFSVETDPRFTSKGPITNPRDKWCPTKIEKWRNFHKQQRTVYGTLNANFPADNYVFENKNFLEGLGKRISKRKIADEKTLEYFLHNSVEDPVRHIIEQLKDDPDASDAFNLGNGVIFENHPHAISDIAEEVVERETPSSPPRTPNQRQDPNQLRADQICIYQADTDHSAQRTMLYICEYKPPHKLTAPHLRKGLRPMNIYKDVVNRKTIPTTVDPEARFEYFAERLTASAITQTFHYMIEGGLEYSLLTTGEAIVFLKIDWNDPGTLYYHLAEPGPEASKHPDRVHVCGAVGQYLAFTLLVMGARGEHGQEERQRAMQNLNTWAVDFETTVRSIPDDERSTAMDPSFIPEPTTYENIDRTPIHQRLRKRLFTQQQCNEDSPKADNQPESSDDESSSRPPETPTPSAEKSGPRRSRRIATRPRGGGSNPGEKGPADAAVVRTEAETGATAHQERSYCTQKCLVGLVKGHELDPLCPNVDSHRGDGNHHPVDHKKWLGMLYKQLQQSLDDGITPLGNGGARGVLFKVTLLAYGYTFVSKGTIRAFIPDLEHEAAVYKRLFPAQGRFVPVFLGAIDLRQMQKVFYYDHRVYVVYMALLSWGGCSLSEVEAAGLPKDELCKLAVQSLRAVHQQHVYHKDVRFANMLFNRETGVMMIDFERAEMLDLRGQLLTPVIPNKRPWAEGSRMGKRSRKITTAEPIFRGEIEELKAIFAYE